MALIWAQNIDAIYLFYGLVFFLMGFAIHTLPKNHSDLVLADKLWLLAIFAYSHALGEWAIIYIPNHTDFLHPLVVNGLKILPVYLWAVSFFALFSFGIELCILGEVFTKRIRSVPIAIFVLWLGLFTLVIYKRIDLFSIGYEEALTYADILARYFLGAPGAFFTAWGLYLIKPELSALGSEKVVRYLKLAVISFVCYGVTAGLIVNPKGIFPASIVNINSFYTLTGVPIEVVRSVSGFLMTLSIINVLHIFNLEYQNKIRRIQQKQTMLAERNRISQDLHDGIIQSVYAVGLLLQSIKAKSANNPSLISELENVIVSMDNIVHETRKYIGGLEFNQEQTALFTRRVRELAQNIEQCKPIKISFSGAWDRPIKLSPSQEKNLYLIIKEALSNVIKHTNSDKVLLALSTRGGNLEVSIKDNGAGFNVAHAQVCSAGGLGLKNITNRAKELNGKAKFISTPFLGTEVSVLVPWEEN